MTLNAYDQTGITYDQAALTYDFPNVGQVSGTWTVDVSWSGQLQGVFVIGTSVVGGPDVLGGQFGNNVFDAVPDVKTIDITRGRTDDLQAMQMGTCTLKLKDATGKYDPNNTANVVSGGQMLMRPLRVQVAYNGTTYTLFYGFITRIEYNPDPRVQETTIEAGDFFEWLALINPQVSAQYNQTVDQLIGTILTAVGSTDPTFRNLASGGDSVAGWTEGENAPVSTQTISITGSPTGGSFTLTLSGQTTGSINYNAAANEVQDALAALLDVGPNNVTCTGGPLPGTSITAAISGVFSAMTHTDSLTGGSSPAVSVTASQAGAPGTQVNALTLIEDLLKTDLGSFFMSSAGVATYKTRASLYANATAVATLDGTLVGYPLSSADVLTVNNAVQATRQFSQQTISITGSPTGGSFTLTLSGQTTGSINYNATASSVQTALAALSNVGTANIACTGGPLPGTAVVANFVGAADTLTHTDGLTGGTSPAVSISASTASSNPQLATNTTSADDYGTRYASALESTNFTSDSQADSYAAFLGTLRGTPRTPARQIRLVNSSDARYVQQLSREIGDVVAVNATSGLGGNTIALTGPIQQIKHAVSSGGLVHTTDFIVQADTVHAFTIGMSTIGGPDVLAY